MATLNDPTDTSGRLIGASQVSGTSVYDTSGEKLGSIYDVMLDKTSGKSEYAILSFGGFLGIGEKYHPLPWSILKYDQVYGGYVVSLDRRTLEGAPTYSADDIAGWKDESWRKRADSYYGTPGHDDLALGGGLGAVPGMVPPLRP